MLLFNIVLGFIDIANIQKGYESYRHELNSWGKRKAYFYAMFHTIHDSGWANGLQVKKKKVSS